jgi:hypothetical protein
MVVAEVVLVVVVVGVVVVRFSQQYFLLQFQVPP